MDSRVASRPAADADGIGDSAGWVSPRIRQFERRRLDAPRLDPLGQGAEVYGRILGLAGGTEMQAFMRGEGRGAVAVALYAAPPYNLRVPAISVSRLSINLTGSRVVGGIEGERGREYMAQRHSLFLTPAGMPMRWHKYSPSRHLNLYFRASAFVEDDQAELARQLEAGGPIHNLLLPGSAPLIQRLAFEMSQDGPFATEAVESLALLLLVQLRRRRMEAGLVEPIPAAVMARLDEYIAANLAERILVVDLAAVAGMPTGRFARAFTRHTGRSPHQYVLWRRIEHAKAMLQRGRASLAEVAAASGFSSQQHMGTVLRLRLGRTPAALRATLSALRDPG